ncbi:MAG: YihY/virulence factor BrkB family protein [Myxococcota bacterium]
MNSFERMRKELAVAIRARLHVVQRHWVLGEVYELIEGVVVQFFLRHGLMYAAALSFFTLLSLLPLVVLFASCAGYALYRLDEDGGSTGLLLADVMSHLERAIPFLGPGFEQDLQLLMASHERLGFIGAIGLLLVASQVFRALEYAFAHIFVGVTEDREGRKRQGKVPRNVVLSKLLFGAFVASLVGVYLATRFVLSLLSSALERLPPALVTLLQGPLDASGAGGVLLDVATTVGIFVVLVKVFTRQRVRTPFAVVGGVTFCTLWAAARWLFGVYLVHFSDFNALYGSFATIMVVVVWVFYSSVILLLSGQLVRVLQQRVLAGPRYPKVR